MNRKILTNKDFYFVNWKKEDIEALLDPVLEAYKLDYTSIISIASAERSFENTVLPLEFAGGVYAEVPSRIELLHSVSPDEEIRNTCLTFQQNYGMRILDIIYDNRVYNALKEYQLGNWKKEKKTLSADSARLFTEMMKGYERLGFNLSSADQKKLKTLKKALTKKSTEFSHNINIYTDHILLGNDDLQGLSPEYVAGLKTNEQGKYVVTLEYPDYVPFMSQSSRADLRKKLAEKYEAKGGKKNLSLLADILKLRKEISSLLGFSSYGDFRLEERMAKNYKTASLFVDGLLQKVKAPAKKDMALLTEMKRQDLGDAHIELELYDTNYYARMYKIQHFGIDGEKLRPWFPYQHVLQTMFDFYGELLGISLIEEGYKMWHKDAKCYRVNDTKSGEVLGYLLLDMFPREGKYGHACMLPLEDGHLSKDGNTRILPIAALICNFPKPTKQRPSLLSLGEVETLFHEFGHATHHLLSSVRYASQAGTNVAWDFVETPSQMPENFLWHKKLLTKISKHYKDGTSLDTKTIAKVIGAKDFLAAWGAQRQLIFARFDLDIHHRDIQDAAKYYKDIYKSVVGREYLEKSLFPAGFGHLMGYDSGYYSYMWALVYAQDIYSMCIKKDGSPDKKQGARYRTEILERGSSRDEIESVESFLGRKVDLASFLKSIGVSNL